MPSPLSLAQYLRSPYVSVLSAIDESEYALGAALDVLRDLSSASQIDIDMQFQSDAGPTSIRELTADGPHMKTLLHQIIAGTDTRSDRVRARQVKDLFDFSIKLDAAAEKCEKIDSTGVLTKEASAFFAGMAMLGALATAFSTGLRTGLRERASNRGDFQRAVPRYPGR